MNEYQKFIYKRSYARYIPELDRREEWHESVERYIDYLKEKIPAARLHTDCMRKASNHILDMEVMPSMRALWTAGPALERDNIGAYNCAYVGVSSLRDFADILYILMNGAGVGFSVERDYINLLPPVPSYITPATTVVTVADTKQGWAEAIRILLDFVFRLHRNVDFDYSRIRPAGSALHTFGGTASGPDPLIELIEFTKGVLKKAQGRQLNSVEVYDIVCMIANCVVSGGVRRSATISLSNLSDSRMRRAKEGQFYIENPQRMLSNNSVAYTERPDMAAFMDEWMSIMTNGTGERGIVNREALGVFSPRRDNGYDLGVNPCGEIALRSRQFCNLTEVVVREDDSLIDLLDKVKSATILGCLQSTLTDFGYIHPDWKKNCEEERLLGVSLTGVMDHPMLSTNTEQCGVWLNTLRMEALHTAKIWAANLGINVPTAITCVKPSGTVSQLVNSASGLHPRYAKYYIRRVRVSATDPVCTLLMQSGFTYWPETGQPKDNANTYVFEFPIKSPENSVVKADMSALDQLEFWKLYKLNWCEHNPSVTIYVKEDEWLKVGSWVYDNWDIIGGLSFLPDDGNVYLLAPYEEITKEQYEEKVDKLPVIPWSSLSVYEFNDQTDGAKELACSGGACEI